MMKILGAFVLGFALSLPAMADDKTEATEVVDSFFSSYVAAMLKEEDGDKVVKKSPQLSAGFKKAYAALMARAWKDEPELGLGYDPILCGQDFPDAGYAVKSLTLKETTGSAVISSKDENFKQTIPVLLVKEDGKWLIHGIDKLKAK